MALLLSRVPPEFMIFRFRSVVFAAVLFLLPSSAFALPQRPGLWLGLRAAYGFPFGAFSNANDYQDTRIFSGLIPFQLDAGWRLDNGIQLGGYAQWALTQNQNFCPDCDGTDLRYGVQATWHFALRRASMLPWFGLAFGRETLDLKIPPLDATYSGWDAMLQLGADARFGGCLEAGPFFGLDVGVFKHLDASFGGPQGSENIRYQAVHYWVNFGVRGAFGASCLAQSPKDR